jgi:hypothetical protein
MNAPIASPDGKGEGHNVKEINRAFVDERAVRVHTRVSCWRRWVGVSKKVFWFPLTLCFCSLRP